MKLLISSLLALATVMSLSGCATDDGRPCPPGTHVGPWGRACRPNR